MPLTVRADIVHYISGALPKDKWVNTLYFDNVIDETGSDLASDLMTLFTPGDGELYTDFVIDINLYDMSAPTPRPVLFTLHHTPGSPIPASSLMPEQVALCMSYYATRNLPTSRGRIYIGPFQAPTGSINVPNSLQIGYLTTLGSALINLTAAQWVQHSQKLGTFSPVTAGWVDNEWDTQRRRLTAATSRSLYS